MPLHGLFIQFKLYLPRGSRQKLCHKFSYQLRSNAFEHTIIHKLFENLLVCATQTLIEVDRSICGMWHAACGIFVQTKNSSYIKGKGLWIKTNIEFMNFAWIMTAPGQEQTLRKCKNIWLPHVRLDIKTLYTYLYMSQKTLLLRLCIYTYYIFLPFSNAKRVIWPIFQLKFAYCSAALTNKSIEFARMGY